MNSLAMESNNWHVSRTRYERLNTRCEYIFNFLLAYINLFYISRIFFFVKASLIEEIQRHLYSPTANLFPLII